MPLPVALGELPSALGEKPSALGERPSALGEKPLALGEKPSALAESKEPAACLREFVIVSTMPVGLNDGVLLIGRAATELANSTAAIMDLNCILIVLRLIDCKEWLGLVGKE